MLNLEELAVLFSLEPNLGVTKCYVALSATKLLPDVRFDIRVAGAVVDRLVSTDLISRDRSGFLYLTVKGKEAIRTTKEATGAIFKKLVYSP